MTIFFKKSQKPYFGTILGFFDQIWAKKNFFYHSNIKTFMQNIKRMFSVSQDIEQLSNMPKISPRSIAKCLQQSDTCCEIFLSTVTVRVIQKSSVQNFIRDLPYEVL